jgi:hypothetical protein
MPRREVSVSGAAKRPETTALEDLSELVLLEVRESGEKEAVSVGEEIEGRAGDGFDRQSDRRPEARAQRGRQASRCLSRGSEQERRGQADGG